MALRHMALKVPGELTSAKEVVDVTGAPFDATARVLQQLAQVGLLRSEQGAQGGYQIQRDLSRVSLNDLIEWVQGPVEVVKCLGPGEKPCELASSCNIQAPLYELNRRTREFYSSFSLKELLRIKESANPQQKGFSGPNGKEWTHERI